MTTTAAKLHRKLSEIRELLDQGLTNAEIGRRLHVERQTIGRIRTELGIPKATTTKHASISVAFRANTKPVDGGHLVWTGERQTTSGTPVLRHREKTYTAARLAFTIRTGREPTGYAIAACGTQHCVAPDHIDDTTDRGRTREQLRYLTGGPAPKDRCVNGHDLGDHVRYEADGRAYCSACKRDRRRTERGAAL